MVHFEEPWLELRVEKYIEPEELIAHLVIEVVGLAGSVDVGQGWLHRANSFDYRLLNALLDFCDIMAFRFKMPPDKFETPFVSCTIIFLVFILYELGAGFINCVIGQMHIEIVQV
jgi:hypothetical protein